MRKIYAPIAFLLIAGCNPNPLLTSPSIRVAQISIPDPTPTLTPAPKPTAISPAPTSVRTQVIVPAYFYPAQASPLWDRLINAARSGNEITVIINPGSGPGQLRNSDYVRVVNALRSAGAKVIGYLPSGYTGQRPGDTQSCSPTGIGRTYIAQDIVTCGRRYNDFYALDGIFVDEMGTTNGTAGQQTDLAYYRAIYDGLKSINPNWVIFGNPGIVAPESYLRNGQNGGADTIITFENSASQYSNASMPPYAARYAATRFGNILHSAASNFDFLSALSQSKRRNVSYFYLTDDNISPNPYDMLPSSFETQLAQIRKTNQSIP